jgi:hypothetical protein
MPSYGIIALVVGGIAFLAVIRLGVVQRRKILKEDFKDAVRNEFQRDYQSAWQKYVPTPQDMMTYRHLLENQQAQTNMSLMMQNSAFAAGGTTLIASFARLNSAIVAKSMKKRAIALHRILYCCQQILAALNSPSESNDVIEYSAELAFQTKEAIRIGALPYNVHNMNSAVA